MTELKLSLLILLEKDALNTTVSYPTTTFQNQSISSLYTIIATTIPKAITTKLQRNTFTAMVFSDNKIANTNKKTPKHAIPPITCLITNQPSKVYLRHAIH